MIALLIQLAVAALFLKIALGVAGVADRENDYGRAFVVAALLTAAGAMVRWLDFGLLTFLWPVAWLFAIRSAYEISWGRAVLVWLTVTAIKVALVMLVLIPLGLAAFTAAAILI